MQEINLYNYWRFGDLFFARSFIKGLSEKFKINFYHSREEKVYRDIINVTEIQGIPGHFDMGRSNLESNNINTWLGVDGNLYIGGTEKDPGYYCTFTRYMKYVGKVLTYFDINLKNYEYYLPEVYYSNLNMNIIEEKFNNLKKNYRDIILICSGPTFSSQAQNFDFSSIIDNLSTQYKDILFLTTSQINTNNSNVKCTLNLFPSLLDISYISEKISLIVGRSSGPYQYTLTKNNLYNKNKKYVCFCDDKHHALFYDFFKCNVMWSNNYNLNNIENIIKESIISLI